MYFINVLLLHPNSSKAILTMSAIQYSSVNLFVRGVPSIMEPEDLAKVLEVYGEMNMNPEAFSVKFRRIQTSDPNRPLYDDQRYNAVLYGFRMNTGPTSCMGHMFSSILQMKRQVRHAWIDQEGKSQYVFITENNRHIPQHLLDELLWKNTNEETKKTAFENNEASRNDLVSSETKEFVEFTEHSVVNSRLSVDGANLCLTKSTDNERTFTRKMSPQEWVRTNAAYARKLDEQRHTEQAAQHGISC